MITRSARSALLALALATLAACGQTTPTSGVPAQGTAPTPAVAPGASTQEPAAASVTPASTEIIASATLPAATATPAAQASPVATGPFAGIEQGTTPEGYHTLGSTSAPVTLVMYSDFL